MQSLLQKLSFGVIAFAIIAMIAIPALSAVVYFGNISDKPGTIPVGTMGQTALMSGCLDANADKYRDYINTSAQVVGLDAAMIAAVIKQESQFNPEAVSNVGAVGMMQIMPDTFTELVGKYGPDYNKAYAAKKQEKGLSAPTPGAVRTNAEYNIFLGTHYLRDAYDRYNHRLDLTFASYNAGPNHPAIVLSKMVPPYEQTQNYVKVVTQNYNDYKTRCQQDLTPKAAATNSSGKSSLGVPLYQQGPSACGTTSVNMVADYVLVANGKPAAHQGSGGCSTARLNSMLNSDLTQAGLPQSYTATPDGKLDDRTTYFQNIQGSLDKNFPVIQGVDTFHSSSGLAASKTHFWVISGYANTGSGVTYTIADPATAQSYTETEDTLWQHSNNPKYGQYIVYAK